MLQWLGTSVTFRVLVCSWNLFMSARFQSDNFSSQISAVPWIYLCVLRDIILLLKVRSDCEISAGHSSTGVNVWLWDICRPFKSWCQCLIVRYLQAFQVLASVSDLIQRKLLLSTPNFVIISNKLHSYKIIEQFSTSKLVHIMRNAGTLNTGMPETLPEWHLKMLWLRNLFDDARRMCTWNIITLWPAFTATQQIL